MVAWPSQNIPGYAVIGTFGFITVPPAADRRHRRAVGTALAPRHAVVNLAALTAALAADDEGRQPLAPLDRRGDRRARYDSWAWS